MKILIKAVMPHRQKILTQDGEEMRLQQWANKQAASSLRDAGDKPQGEQFTQSRDMLMRDAVENPDKHGLKFMGERLPFEGQNLQESLSEPTFDNEADKEIADFHHEEELRTYGKDESEIERDARYPGGVKLPGEELPNLFDSEGKLRDGMPPEEEFNPDEEAEHMRRIMTSRQVPMRDAWSLLKNDFFNPPQVPCAKCGKPTEPMMYYGSNQMGPQDNTLCEQCEDPRYNTMMEDQ